MVTIVSDIAHNWTLTFKGNMYLYDNVNKSSINMSKLYMCFYYLGYAGADPGFDLGGPQIMTGLNC